ncbi:uncharacterized protein LOC135710158 [Ochlerotatus camptorhynchus]|uniref:uncharacterized protein LOC135710158 n=1 Tax=Ochlerotatus camptorhynchus TaxID=644619 RepID=UPI0031D8B73D
MKLHFDSKLCQYPQTIFPFVLNFLLWDRNLLTKVCTSCPFYRYSSTFVGLYLIVNLIFASYELIQQMLNPIATDKLTVPLRVWKLNLTLQIPHQYLLLGRALFSVQALARTLYNLVVGNVEALLGLVLFVPIFFAMNVIQFASECRMKWGDVEFRTVLWKQMLRLGSTVVFWSNICCLLYNQYAGCIFDHT